VSDESVLGGLSLLLMAGQHVTASPLLTTSTAAATVDTKPNNLLLNASTVGTLDAPPWHHRVSSVFVSVSNVVMVVNGNGNVH